jgi:membrane protein DedA with SNARE-associated domain
VPVPEESILVLAGYLVWQGDIRLPLVLLVGILSAIAGDNLGYWIGRRYGQEAIARYGRWVLLTPARLDAPRRFVTRYGAFGVFAARFIAGLRFMAGPLAGAQASPRWRSSRRLPWARRSAFRRWSRRAMALPMGWAII